VLLVVEEAALLVAVDHRALEAELADAALELGGGRLRIRGRQGGEAGEAFRVRFHGVGEPVVRIARHGDRDVGAERLRAGRAEREHLHVDAGRVHVREPALAEVEVLRDDVVAHHLAAGLQVELAELVRRDVLAVHRGEEVLLDRDDFQSSLAPLSLTSFAHLSMSARMKRRNSSGELPTGSEPSASMRLFTSGCFRILISSSCRRVRIGGGRFAGPITPYQPTTSKPGSASAIAGISGLDGRRLGVVTAMARSRPARTCTCAPCSPEKLKWYCPATRSAIAGPAPLYGMCSAFTPAMSL